MEDDDDEQIKVKDVIPEEYQSVFPFENFNEMQSSLFEQIYESDVNMTVAAPTGTTLTADYIALVIAFVSLLAS